jgi:hypothetical protein
MSSQPCFAGGTDDGTAATMPCMEVHVDMDIDD